MVFPEVMTGISEVLEDTGLQPVVGVSNYSHDREEQVIYEMLSWRPSGLILVGCREVVAEVDPECGPEGELRHPATVESHGTVLSLVID